MAEPAAGDRLQPSLLDRLTDLHPEERRESVEARVLSRQQLRAAVLRDLSWLMNTTRPEPEAASARKDEIELWRPYADARRSVLNFGMPEFAGVTKAALDKPVMEAAIKRTIAAFEPRLDAKTLSVTIHIDYDLPLNNLQLTIRGQMWAQPMPLELLLAADFDLESGDTSLRDLR
ncbi:MAG: type VI secretion system baseplate subunit TssE [Caldimonas sp.]